MSEKTVRCIVCRTEFTDKALVDCERCPVCGTESVPMAIADDVSIAINLHELRLLTIWASNWCEHFCKEIPEDQATDARQGLNSVLAALRDQLPGASLTLGDELQALADDLQTDVTLKNTQGVTTIKPSLKN